MVITEIFKQSVGRVGDKINNISNKVVNSRVGQNLLIKFNEKFSSKIKIFEKDIEKSFKNFSDIKTSRFKYIFNDKFKSESIGIEDKLSSIIPEIQMNKIINIIRKKIPGGNKASISMKIVIKNKNIRLIAERPGYDGFQIFSYEITPDGKTKRILQTAFDSARNIVKQKPGMPKNNLFDIKKW